MKLEIEVYDLNQQLFMLKNNEVTTIYPKAMSIKCTYNGYSGENWGDTIGSGDNPSGYPLRIYYSIEQAPKENDWINHKKLFPTKEALLKSL